jgi:hypothetical protein
MKITQPDRTHFFKHDLLSRYDLLREDGSSGRNYSFKGSRYPSITTVLSKTSDKSGLDAWKKRVGEEEAKKIIARSSRRGQSLHLICEHYLLNYERYDSGANPITTFLFNQIKDFLDKKIETLYGVELPLFSHSLKVAGTCDVLCKINGLSTITDFKTSASPKNKEWIIDYFLQTTAYSIMAEEMYDIKFEQLCLVITTESGDPQIFIEPTAPYINELKARLIKFYS